MKVRLARLWAVGLAAAISAAPAAFAQPAQQKQQDLKGAEAVGQRDDMTGDTVADLRHWCGLLSV